MEMGTLFASEDTTKHARARGDLIVSELLNSGYGPGQAARPSQS